MKYDRKYIVKIVIINGKLSKIQIKYIGKREHQHIYFCFKYIE